MDPAASSDQEFSAAFASAQVDPTGADAPANPPASSSDVTRADTASDPQTTTDTEAPAGAQPGAPAPAGDVASPAGPTSEHERELIALRQQLADAQHRERSSARRISAFEKKATEATRQLEALRATSAASTSAPTTAPPPAATGADADADDGILADAPEVRAAVQRMLARATTPLAARADALARELETLKSQTADAAAAVQPIVERDAEAQMRELTSSLNRDFPRWDTVVTTPQYVSWLQQQPRSIRDMAADSNDFGEVATVLRLYRAAFPNDLPAPALATAGASTTPPAPPARHRPPPAGLPTRSAPTPTASDPNDFSAGFREAKV